jgi:hypothetical protein
MPTITPAGPPRNPDQRAGQSANRCAGKIIRRLLDGQLASSIFGDDGQSVKREIALGMKLRQSARALIRLRLAAKCGHDKFTHDV